MSNILIDTSILIDYLRTKSHKHHTEWFLLSEKDYRFAISLITYAELYSGKGVWEYKRAKKELESLLSFFEILPFEKEIAKKAGEIRAKYHLNLLDCAIAATGIIYDMHIATLNTKDFEKIKGIQLFPLE